MEARKSFDVSALHFKPSTEDNELVDEEILKGRVSNTSAIKKGTPSCKLYSRFFVIKSSNVKPCWVLEVLATKNKISQNS